MKCKVVLFLLLSVPNVCAENEKSLIKARVKRVQVLYQLMKDTHELLTLKGIPYWMEFGTLLGAVRHQGMIPWDFDLDISIMEVDKPKLAELKPLFEQLGYSFHKRGIYKIGRRTLTLDVLTMKIDNGMVVYAEKGYLWKEGARDGKPLHYTIGELFPLREYRFGDLVLTGAQNPIPLLNAHYGEDWPSIAVYKSRKKGYSKIRVELTDELKKPALPRCPLLDRVKDLDI